MTRPSAPTRPGNLLEHSTSPISRSTDDAPGAGEPSLLRDAAHWWEPRRILYNILLAGVFVALTVRTWPRLQPELNSSAVLPLIVLAILANLCYCAAYAVDLAVFSVPAPARRNRWRWALWSAGTLFAMFFETYWFLDEILPPLR
jgi:hypothetical protein